MFFTSIIMAMQGCLKSLVLVLLLLPVISFGQKKSIISDSTSLKTDSYKVEKLAQVVIRPSTEIKEIGYCNLRKTFLPTRVRYLNKKNYIGMYIKNPNPKKTSFIKELILETTTRGPFKDQQWTKIQVRLYKFDPISKTLKEMLLEHIIQVPQGAHTLKVNVEKQNIQLPSEGLFFALKSMENQGTVAIHIGKLNDTKEVFSYFFDPANNQLLMLSIPETEKKFALMLGLSIHQY